MQSHKYLPSVTNCCQTLLFCIAIVNLTLIYFQDYRLAFLVINIFADFLYCIKMMSIMSLKRFSLLIDTAYSGRGDQYLHRNQCTCTCTCTWDVGTCTCTRTWRLSTRTCTCTWSFSTWYSSNINSDFGHISYRFRDNWRLHLENGWFSHPPLFTPRRRTR